MARTKRYTDCGIFRVTGASMPKLLSFIVTRLAAASLLALSALGFAGLLGSPQAASLHALAVCVGAFFVLLLVFPDALAKMQASLRERIERSRGLQR